MMRCFICFIFVFMFTLSMAATEASALEAPAMPDEGEISRLSETRAVIQTKLGDIELVFFPQVAPIHVKNFVTLASQGFYDGTVFHRVIPGFMIQGGDPRSRDASASGYGTGGPGYTINAEFSEMPHKRGTLSMARMQHPDSAGSQFFICVTRVRSLDRKYSVFGEVVSGMDVVDTIVNLQRDRWDKPFERVEVSVRVIEPELPATGVENTPVGPMEPVGPIESIEMNEN